MERMLAIFKSITDINSFYDIELYSQVIKKYNFF